MNQQIESNNNNNNNGESSFLMIEESICLRHQEIKDFLKDKVDWLQLVRVKLHLNQCVTCQEKVAWFEERFDPADYEYLPELGGKIQKILDLIPVSEPETAKKSINIGFLSWESVALSFVGHGQAGWQIQTKEGPSEEQYDVARNRDSDDNLNFRFSLPNSLIKNKHKICLKCEGFSKAAELERDGKRWFAQICIEREDRENLSYGEDIEICIED